MGVYGSPAAPEAAVSGACTNSIAHGWAPVGAMQFHLELAPGQEEAILLGLGYVENPGGVERGVKEVYVDGMRLDGRVIPPPAGEKPCPCASSWAKK